MLEINPKSQIKQSNIALMPVSALTHSIPTVWTHFRSECGLRWSGSYISCHGNTTDWSSRTPNPNQNPHSRNQTTSTLIKGHEFSNWHSNDVEISYWLLFEWDLDTGIFWSQHSEVISGITLQNDTMKSDYTFAIVASNLWTVMKN